MGLVVKPIYIGDGAWVGAFARIAPGVRVGLEAIVVMGAVLLTDAEPAGIYRGNPAVKTGHRSVGRGPSRDSFPGVKQEQYAKGT